MSDWKGLDSGVSAAGMRFAIVAARFNDFIVQQLIAGAVDGLKQHGAADSDVELLRVPGAFELPFAAQALAKRGNLDAIVALGCVIRGATSHFEYVAGACVNGLVNVSTAFGIPVVLGVLTTETIDQAMERASVTAGNKGLDAALTAIEMAALAARLRTS